MQLQAALARRRAPSARRQVRCVPQFGLRLSFEHCVEHVLSSCVCKSVQRRMRATTRACVHRGLHVFNSNVLHTGKAHHCCPVLAVLHCCIRHSEQPVCVRAVDGYTYPGVGSAALNLDASVYAARHVRGTVGVQSDCELLCWHLCMKAVLRRCAMLSIRTVQRRTAEQRHHDGMQVPDGTPRMQPRLRGATWHSLQIRCANTLLRCRVMPAGT